MSEASTGSSSNGTVRVLAAVARRGETLLVCQRPSNKRHGGLWEFPGGKCEAGETDANALQREMHEELGVELSYVGTEYFATQDPGSSFHIAFIPVVLLGEPICLEHSALAWETLATLETFALAPSDRRFVDFLRADLSALSSSDKSLT